MTVVGERAQRLTQPPGHLGRRRDVVDFEGLQIPDAHPGCEVEHIDFSREPLSRGRQNPCSPHLEGQASGVLLSGGKVVAFPP